MTNRQQGYLIKRILRERGLRGVSVHHPGAAYYGGNGGGLIDVYLSETPAEACSYSRGELEHLIRDITGNSPVKVTFQGE